MSERALFAAFLAAMQVVTLLSVAPVFTEEAAAEKGIVEAFTNGHGVHEMILEERGENWSLAFKLPANATILNATFKVTGEFLERVQHVDHKSDSPEGWGGEGMNQPEANNTTSADNGESIVLHLSQLGPLLSRVAFSAGSSPTGVAVGDIDSDGDNEVVVCNQGNNNISVYNTGPNGLTFASSQSTSSGPWDVAIGDVSNDSRKDVVVSSGNGATCYIDVFLQKTDGTLSSKSSYQVSSSSSKVYFVDVGDVNSDSLNDVVTVDQAGSYLMVLLQNSTTGLLDSATSYTIGAGGSGVAIGNVYSGGKGNEVAVYYEPLTYYYYYIDPTLRVYQQSGGSLATYKTFTMSTWVYYYGKTGTPRPVEVGDLSGDGKDDVVVCWGDYYGSCHMYVYVQDGNGELSGYTDYTSSVTSPRHLAIGDITGDGKNELLVVNVDSNNFVVFNQTSQGKLNNLRSYQASGSGPTGIDIGDVNDDGKNDVVVAEKSSGKVGVYYQPAWFNGSFLSKRLTGPKPNDYAKILGARAYWNVSNNGEQSTILLSNNDGQSWQNVTGKKGQWLEFNTSGSALRYMLWLNSSRGHITPKFQDISLDYRYGADPKDIQIDICNDQEDYEYVHDGFLNGSEWVRDFSAALNRYIQENQDLKDGAGYITIPIYFRWGGMGRLTFSDIQIRFNRPSHRPVLVEPEDGQYVGSTPPLKITCVDPDEDELLYRVEISENKAFSVIDRAMDMTSSTAGWTKAIYESGELAVYETPPNKMFPSGKVYYWRVRVFDGTVWSEYSRTGTFSIDSEAPLASAFSPQYTKSNDFEVTWEGSDPMPGSGLAPAPFDVQYKIDDGDWVDWKVATAETSALFSGEQGHTYYFRARATDIAGNRKIYSGGNGDTSTTIDPAPPSSSVEPLPAFMSTTAFTVSWSGTDGLGGSGIESFDVQVRDGSGPWMDWLMATSSTSGEYQGTNGHTYSFQCRARDRAGNVEDYPGGDGDTSAEIDSTPPSGRVEDEGAETSSAVSLRASLKFSDPESGISRYEYRVATGIEGPELVPPTATTDAELEIKGLNLSVGGNYFIGARARNGAGMWSPWVWTDGIVVTSAGCTASLSYADGVQDSEEILVTLGGTEASGARIVDGDLEVRSAPYYRGELGAWGSWTEVGADRGDTLSAVYTGERGRAYEFRYRIQSEYGVWSAYAAGGHSIRINAPPVVVLGPDLSAEAGRRIPLDGTRCWDPDGDAIVAWFWDFGDGRNSTEANVSHAWSRPGTYTLSLTASDGSQSATASVIVVVRERAVTSTPGFGGAALAAAVGAALVAWRRRARGR
ncbi:MAG: FG-GAP-like repeat-containing protein [Thermoplasmatota archaeon]